MRYPLCVNLIVTAMVGVSLLAGCANTVAVSPPPGKASWQQQGADKNAQVDVLFKRDKKGKILYQEVRDVSGRYTGGSHDSPDVVRQKAVNEMILNANNSVNGISIASRVDTMSKTWTNASGTTSIDDFEQNATARVINVGRIVGEPTCIRSYTQEETITYLCSGTVAIPVLEGVAAK